MLLLALLISDCCRLEGVLRKHMIVCGSSRDTAVYSIVNSDWRDCLKAAMETKLYNAPAAAKAAS
jgi:hypothetical protein